jgi:hypothetical protein
MASRGTLIPVSKEASTRPEGSIPITRGRTVHVSRTMMLAEASTVLAAVPAKAGLADYRHAIITENVLLKRTMMNRLHTYQKLKQLYVFEPAEPVFAALRTFWDEDPAGRPLLACLNAAFRDEVLAPTCDIILQLAVAKPVSNGAFSEVVRATYPDRFSATSLKSIGRNAGSTWTQSGHLEGTKIRRRAQPDATVGAVAFALLLGWLTGLRGLSLFDSTWARLVSPRSADLDTLAFAASNRDWLRYKRLGDVVEIDFTAFLATLEVPLG